MPEGSRLPGTPDEEARDRIVLHVDMDCFYAACERRRESKLRGEPLVVGMGYEDGEDYGAVATASYEAREYGVESAQAISSALERLPRKAEVGEDADDAGYYRPVDMEYYESVSEEVKAILHESADVVREVSIDEAYLDVTERTAWEVAEGFARHVKHRIDREVGVTASVGVAPNMSTAKIASDYDKPDGLVVVEPDEVQEFLAPLDVAEIHGVGPVTARELREMGVETAGDLAGADPDALEDRFGERGTEMYQRARGTDDREVTPTGKPKSLSRESAFTEATDDPERTRERIRTLAEAVADRASRKGVMYRTIGIKAVTTPYDVNTRASSLPGPVDDPELVEAVALDLFEEFESVEVRKVGVRVSKLSFADADQSSLGDGWTANGDDSGQHEADANRDTDAGQQGLDADWEDAGRQGSDAPDQRGLDADWATPESAPRGQVSLDTEWESPESGAREQSDGQASRDGQASLDAGWDSATGDQSESATGDQSDRDRRPTSEAETDPTQTSLWDFVDENSA